MTPGFSERTFEFCFNAEYCQLNKAVLATHPHIPTQRAEKDLGYDVEFKIKSGGFNRSLFLQHKVASYAEVLAGKNAKFYNVHKKPYFRFPVDKNQHNTLCDLNSSKGNAFYCAPRFHLRNQLETHFWAGSIAANSALLVPTDVGYISDDERHNITFDSAGINSTLHSVPRPFQGVFTGTGEGAPELRSVDMSEGYIEELADILMLRASNRTGDRTILREIRSSRPIEQVQVILGRVFQVTWLLLPSSEVQPDVRADSPQQP